MHKMLTVIWELICKHFVIQILPCVLFSWMSGYSVYNVTPFTVFSFQKSTCAEHA
jgi:hypothetical protein